MDRVFGVKEGKVLIKVFWFCLVPFTEMWKPTAEAGWEENIKFHFDISFKFLLHIRVEMKNRQMYKQAWSLEEHLD